MNVDIIGDLDDSVRLQRYMNFAKFISLLDNREIFLCKTSLFEDELEGGFTVIDEMLSDGSAAILDNVVNNLLPTVNKQTLEEREERNKISADVMKHVEEEPYHTVFGDIEKKDFSHQELHERIKDFIDVCCWHSNEKESMAMWKIYGEDDFAVCVITDVGNIKRSIIKNKEYKILIAKVKYLIYEDEHFKQEHPLAQYMHKTDFYSYENEVRIIGYDPTSNIYEERKASGTRIGVNLQELVQEIRVSSTAPDWFLGLVRSICKKFSLDVQVCRSGINIKHSYYNKK
ncbi:hypothetical protein GZ59_43670 [Pectobacterium atrosepticum]|uniref:DUF2971 domain-containing protein n=1 Tax=Pectobacterium atrosepticum TaxID=29471 RepID=UPI0004E850AE|nr:DUF2971 domain-containing protein [Pectobacterium atrosepticum]AIK16054.1 hypothetical protein GZ59_43670 [Pectobacterium atrosepticum]